MSSNAEGSGSHSHSVSGASSDMGGADEEARVGGASNTEQATLLGPGAGNARFGSVVATRPTGRLVSCLKSKMAWTMACVAAGVVVIAVVALSIALQDETKPLVYEPSVIIVSLDGFRYDYVDMYPELDTPNIDRILGQGVHATSMKPRFPSLTFPNHYSIITGEYTESHGLVFNSMYDPQMNATYTLSDHAAVSNNAWYDGKHPMWVTAIEQDQRAGVYFWPGSEADIAGIRPDWFFRYDKSVPYEERVDTLLSWLRLDDDARPRFMALYMSAVDTAGHYYGPGSPEVGEAIQRVDAALGRLLDGIESMGLESVINLIVVSDHGMAGLSPDRALALDAYLDIRPSHVVHNGAQDPRVRYTQFLRSDCTACDRAHTRDVPHGSTHAPARDEADPRPVVYADVLTYSPVTQFWTRDGDEASLAAIETALANLTHYKVYRKHEIPEHLHFQDNDRIPPMIGIADIGWTIVPTAADIPGVSGGAHGYDPDHMEMHAIFWGWGGGFRAGATVPEVRNIDVYPLMCHILNLETPPNNGTLDRISDVLTTE